jgi:hypothetical protein
MSCRSGRDLADRLRWFGEHNDGFQRGTLWRITQEAADEIERLRRSLAYYADPRNYTEGDAPGHIYALDDGGKNARKVLGLLVHVDQDELWDVGRKCSEIAFGEEP